MLRLNPKTYFIAICRYHGASHNFVMAGEYARAAEADHQKHPYQFNFAVGKFNGADYPNMCAIVCVGSPAYVDYEEAIYRVRRKNAEHAYTTELFYQAYEVSRDQHDALFYHFMDIRPADPSNNISHPEIPTYCQLSPMNNCRHTGIHLLQQVGINDPAISTSFLSRMYNRMLVQDKQITKPIFILPVPLTAEFKLSSPLRSKILNELRTHMVYLAKTSYGRKLGVHKVNALRDLYKQLQNAESDDPRDLLGIMHTWKESSSPWRNESNMALMNAQRRSSWLAFFNPKRTSSSLLIDKLIHSTYSEALSIKLSWMERPLLSR